jgi:cardiolipin synthase
MLYPGNRVRAAYNVRHARRRLCSGSAGRAAAGALRISNTVGAAITNRRIPGPAEAGLMTGVGMALLAFAALALAWPLLVAFPLAALGAWIAVAFLVKAFKLRAEDGKVAGSTNAGPD